MAWKGLEAPAIQGKRDCMRLWLCKVVVNRTTATEQKGQSQQKQPTIPANVTLYTAYSRYCTDVTTVS